MEVSYYFHMSSIIHFWEAWIVMSCRIMDRFPWTGNHQCFTDWAPTGTSGLLGSQMWLNRSSFSFGIIPPQLTIVEQPILSTSWIIMVCIDISCISEYITHSVCMSIYVYIMYIYIYILYIYIHIIIQKLMIGFSNIRNPSTAVCCPPSLYGNRLGPSLAVLARLEASGLFSEPKPDVYCQIIRHNQMFYCHSFKQFRIAQSYCFRDHPAVKNH